MLSLVTVWHGVRGGMEVHGRLLTRGLAALGHRVTVISSRNPSGVEVEMREGVTYHYLNGTSFGFQRGRWASESAARFTALHRETPVDVLCCQHCVASAPLRDFCRHQGIPIVAILEGHEGLMLLSELRQMASHRRGYTRVPRRILAFIYYYLRWEFPVLWSCARVIAVSREIVRSIHRWFGVPLNRIDCVYNGVDTETFRPDPVARQQVRRQLDLADDVPVLLFLSSVTKQKGLHVLLRALPHILTSHAKTRLLVGGEGDFLAEARRLVDDLGLMESVIFLGEVPHEQTPECLAACDVFALPTLRQEGLPFALLEAMACGKSVVASRIGGIPSVLRDGHNGIMVRPDDPEGLALAILRLLGDQSFASRLGKNARETIEHGYSVDEMVQGTAAILDRVMRNHMHTPREAG
jgi:glycosyltransferase involved in cell wall biosynthesis